MQQGTVVASVVGTKGMGAVAKTGVSTTKAAVQKGAAAANNMKKTPDITKYLPYAPRQQMAFAGGVPYNVVNGVGLKEKGDLHGEGGDGRLRGRVKNIKTIRL